MIDKIKQKHKEGGFTIIEVMIVLAIAGLIMVVVFLAVPALQRSGRNNSINTNAQSVLSGVGEFVANNNGTLPTTPSAVTTNGADITLGCASGCSTAKVTVSDEVNFIVGGTAWTNTTIAGTTGPGATAAKTPGSMQLVTGTTAKCNDAGTGLSGAANTRSYALLYVVEISGGVALRCIGN